MTDSHPQPASISEIIQSILDDEIALDLRPRDVALLVQIRHQTDSRQDLSFTVGEDRLRALSTWVTKYLAVQKGIAGLLASSEASQ